MGVKAAPSKKIKKPAKQNIQTKEPDEDPNNHYGNPENTDPQILSQKMSLMVEIKAIKIQIERQGQRMNNDPHMIHTLHEYNYLKDATFKLCDAISNIKGTSCKEVFEEFEIKDLDQGKWLGKSKF